MSIVLDVIGSINVKDTLNDADAESCVHRWLDEGVELGGLQEFGKQRDPILAKLGNGHIRHGRGDNGGGPLVWNSTRYGLARKIKSKTLAGPGFVGRLVGRRSKLGPSVATVGVFHDEILGERVTLINIHLTAEVQLGATYRNDANHAARVRRHKAERRALGRLVRAHRLRGNRVLVVGDTNYDGFDCPPLVSCWRNRPGHTLGDRAVDVVLAPERADSVQTIPTKSDHDALVATYRRN